MKPVALVEPLSFREKSLVARRLPVVVLTSSAEDKDRVESYVRGANSFVRKPVDFVEFAGAVQSLGMYWFVLNETSES
jgi:CheY-like chemotaxis protein